MRKNGYVYKLPINIKICAAKYPKSMELSFAKGQFPAIFYKIQAVNLKRTRALFREIQKTKRIEGAAQFHLLIEENGWTKSELARHLGVSRGWVTKVLKVL